MITISQITTNSAFDSLEADWHRLVADNHQPASVFNGWHWNRLWWEHYAHLGNLFIIVVHLDGKAVCIAPFYLGKTKALRVQSVTTLRFLGSGGDTSPDSLDILVSNSHIEVAVGELCQHLMRQPQIGRFELRDLPEHSQFLQRFLKHARLVRLPSPQKYAEQRRVQTLPANLSQYTDSLSRNTRKHWKRRQKRFNQAGEAHYQLCRSPDEVQQTLQELIKLHRTRRASQSEEGSFRSASYIEFHRNLMLNMLDRDELRLLVMKLNGRIVGIEYAFLVNKVLYFFQTGFDPEFQHLSPGHLLMTHLIETAIQEKAQSIDLLKGNYEYKSSYAKQWRTSVSVSLWRNTVTAWCYRMIHGHMRGA